MIFEIMKMVEVVEALESKFDCRNCLKMSNLDIKNDLIKVVEKSHQDIIDNDNLINEKKKKLLTIEKEINSNTGKTVSGINEVMKKLRISLEVYHGNIYTATTSLKWLENHEVFLECITNDGLKEKWREIFNLFR